MAKLTDKSASGTSFHDVTITFSVNFLTQLLGPPQMAWNDGTDKVNFEWICETKDGDVFTIYDWKEYRKLGLDEIIEWHIGSHEYTVSVDAKHEILRMF
jgi:hypothetical protein